MKSGFGRLLLPLLGALLCWGGPLGAADWDDLAEPQFKGWKELGNWEERQLRQADKAYANEEAGKARWRLSGAAYGAFIEEFPNSIALSYALYRQARSYHRDGLRNKARLVYQDIIDFFGDDVPFATAAAYFKGVSFVQDSDEEKAMQAWSIIAQDEDYRRQNLAGFAIFSLAEHVWKKGKKGKAVDYFKDLVANFRHRNKEASKHAIEKVVDFYTKYDPDEPALRRFFVDALGFDERPVKGKDPLTFEGVAQRHDYWKKVMRQVHEHRRWGFNELQRDELETYSGYWAEQMEGRLPKWDEYQLFRIRLQHTAEGDLAKTVKRIDEQFEVGYKDGDAGRVLEWMEIYAGEHGWDFVRNEEKVEQYFKKLEVDKLGFHHLMEAVKSAYRINSGAMIEMITSRIRSRLDRFGDDDRVRTGRYFWDRNHQKKDLGRAAFDAMEDDERGRYELLRLLAKDDEEELDEKLRLADGLETSKRYGGKAMWIKGELLEAEKRWADAIPAFNKAGEGAKSGFKVAHCYMQMNKLGSAINELRRVENLFKREADDACLKQAEYYHAKGKKDERNATLIRCVKQYKGSGGASKAHQWGEDLGLDFHGADKGD